MTYLTPRVNREDAMDVTNGMTNATSDGGSDAAVRAHLKHLRLQGRADLTIKHREEELRRLAAVLPVPLLAATADDLYAWRAGLNVGPATVCNYVSHVRAFYDWALAARHVTENPARDIPVPKLPRRHPRPISEPELRHALEHGPASIRIWLVLAGWCGLRAKEIALLQADYIRLYDDHPHLKVAFDATKGSSERTVPLHPFAVAELQRAALPAAGYVFRKLDGQPVTPNLVSKLSNQHLHALGIHDTLHTLRHRFGTTAYAAEHDLRAVQELLGHSRIDTTAGYAAVDSTALAKTVNAIPPPLERRAS